MGGSFGLVVMWGDLCSKGRGFESQRRILDGHNIFSDMFVVRNVMFVWKDENKQKRGREWPIFIKNDSINNCVSCLDIILFWKFLSVDIVLEPKSCILMFRVKCFTTQLSRCPKIFGLSLKELAKKPIQK